MDTLEHHPIATDETGVFLKWADEARKEVVAQWPHGYITQSGLLTGFARGLSPKETATIYGRPF